MMGKVLVFPLSRYGYANYAAEMIDHLQVPETLIILSKYHSVPTKKQFRTIPTYRNTWEFILASLFRLPLFLVRIIYTIKNQKVKVAYFPGFHAWDLPIILVCKLRKIPVVYTVHDAILHEGENYFSHRWLQKACIQKSDELIFLTNYMRNAVHPNLLRKCATSIIPHGPISLEKIVPQHQHTKKLKLLFLGRIGKYKGLELLLEALTRAEDEIWSHLTIAGKSLYPLKIPNKQKINVIQGWLSEAQIADLLNSHDVLVLPYCSATQSGVITLGITATIPMVCTRVGGLVEQLEEDEAIWVEPEPVSILNGIQLLSEDPLAYSNLHQKLLEKRKRLSWEEPANQLAEVLRKYLSNYS